MTCCKAEKHNDWCISQPLSEYKDEHGKEYCIYHAPQGYKIIKGQKLTTTAFNELIFQHIGQAKSHCNLSGTIYEGDISFTNYNKENPLPYVSFRDSNFPNKVDFSGVYFKHLAIFDGSYFAEETSFQDTHFASTAQFCWTNFRDRAYFGHSFARNATFMGAHFEKSASFINACIAEVADYRNCHIVGRATFDGAKFGWNAIFSETHFEGIISMRETTFHGRAVFDNIIADDEIICVQSNFGCKVSFHNAIFHRTAYFQGETFLSEGCFNNLNIQDCIKFEGTRLIDVSFLDTNLTKIDFINCHWRKSSRRSSRPILFDESYIYTQAILKPCNDFTSKATDQSDRNIFRKINYDMANKIESLYRMLKQKHKEDHDEASAAIWHYNEKTIFRLKNPWRRYLPSLTTLYWISSGYGERPVRAGIALIALWTSLSIIILASGVTVDSNVFGLTTNGLRTGLTLNSLWASMVNSLKIAMFQKDIFIIPASGVSEIIKLLIQTILPLQTTFYIFAVRNRFRR